MGLDCREMYLNLDNFRISIVVESGVEFHIPNLNLKWDTQFDVSTELIVPTGDSQFGAKDANIYMNC